MEVFKKEAKYGDTKPVELAQVVEESFVPDPYYTTGELEKVREQVEKQGRFLGRLVEYLVSKKRLKVEEVPALLGEYFCLSATED